MKQIDPSFEGMIHSILERVCPPDDPAWSGMTDTPRRVLRALLEMTEGYDVDIPALFDAKFLCENYDELVILTGIRFSSLCEHHVLPFYGTAAIGYLPGSCVIGVSKLARIVHAYSKRFQIQERLTRQIGTSIDQHLKARGVAVMLKGRHACMGCRGANQPDSTMVTSYMSGVFRTSASARSEFLALLNDVS